MYVYAYVYIYIYIQLPSAYPPPCLEFFGQITKRPANQQSSKPSNQQTNKPKTASKVIENKGLLGASWGFLGPLGGILGPS